MFILEKLGPVLLIKRNKKPNFLYEFKSGPQVNVITTKPTISILNAKVTTRIGDTSILKNQVNH
jgi:hypothetical protein